MKYVSYIVFLCFMSIMKVSHAQGGGNNGTATLNGTISGHYSHVSSSHDTYSASLSATYYNANGSAAYGYGYGLPRLKYKYFHITSGQTTTPELLVPNPNSFGAGGTGSVPASGTGTLDSWDFLTNEDSLFHISVNVLIRQWKLLGYCGSQEAQAGNDLGNGILAPADQYPN